MLALIVRLQNGLKRVGDRLQEEHGLSAIEYGVFAAFLVLALVAVATFAGPALKDWMLGTMCGIMGKTYSGGSCH